MLRGFFTALLFLLGVTGLRSETYGDWARGIPNQPAIAFTDWMKPSVGSVRVDGDDRPVFEAPIGRLIGHFDFSSLPAQDFPLTVRVIYRHIDRFAANESPIDSRERTKQWTSSLGCLSPDVSVGDVIERREMVLPTAAAGASVPAWALSSFSSFNYRRELENAYSIFLEIAGPDGTVLARKLLVEAVMGTARNNLLVARTGSDEDAYLRSLGTLVSIDTLPTEPEFYDGVKVLWLDDKTLRDTRYTDSFWRLLLLGGTQLVGRDAQVQDLADRLGIQPNQRVLKGALWSADHPAFDLAETLKSNPYDGSYSLVLKDDNNPFRLSFAFAKKRTHQLRAFSIGFLVIFALFEGAVILGSFFLLRGPRRVLRWLLIPASAILYTALGFIVVHFLVDFRPEVQMLREVDSVEGWPESLVHNSITRLGFDDERATFITPGLARFGAGIIDAGSMPLESLQAPGQTRFSLHQRYGRFSTATIQYTAPGQNFIQTGARGEITSSRNLAGAWAWDGTAWRNLGPLTAGKPVRLDLSDMAIDPAKSRPHAQPMVQNYPWENRDLPATVREMCTFDFMQSLKDSGVGILLAIDDEPPSEQFDGDARTEVHTQTLLVHQFPLPGPQP